ncbi:unnamed protein product [Macrosiphum euphorbiae]|uniref:Uncharacterized protein n=1 Tax=Macrosiphum euphorbiae TaxID=13131 RepID=A0AAV0VQP9_9HEMI|nr:unnamed protein product [Macrosiphum euphorbiae]
MRVIHFYLVSIFLSGAKLSLGMLKGVGLMTANSPTSIMSGIDLSSQKTKSSILFPSSTNNNRSTSKFSMNKSNNQALNSNNYITSEMSVVNKNKSHTFASQNHIALQLAESFYDSPGEPGTDSFKLYDATASVFKAIFKTWLKSKDQLDDVANRLGIPDEIVLTVNGSMAQLFAFQHDNNILIELENISRVFYYMTDVKHMIKRDKNMDTVIDTIKPLIKNIEHDRALNDIGEYGDSDLDTVVGNLNDFLENYKNDNYNNSDIMVNAALMKGMMLINQTENDEFNYALNKLRISLSKEFLKKVEDNQYEIDGSLIAENHVEVIRNSMPSIFSLLLNHIELLKILSTHTLVDSEQKITQYVSKCLKKIMSTFINRFKNVGKLNQKEISDLDKIAQLLENLDTGKADKENNEEPSKTSQENTQDSSETDKNKTQEPTTPKLDIKELLALTEPAIAAVLNLAGEKDVQKWKNNTVFKFKNFQKNQVKEYYMNLLTNNSDTAYYLVRSFEKKFLNEIDYKKFHDGGSQNYFI